jgi:hypothetical protein
MTLLPDSAVRAATRVRVARLPAQADDDEPVLRYRVVGMVSGKAASTPSVPPPALPSFLSPVTPTEPARKRTKLAMDTPASSVKPEPVTEEKKSARKFAQETPSEVRPEARSTQKRGVAAAAAAAAVVAEEALAIQRTVVIPDSLKPVYVLRTFSILKFCHCLSLYIDSCLSLYIDSIAVVVMAHWRIRTLPLLFLLV